LLPSQSHVQDHDAFRLRPQQKLMRLEVVPRVFHNSCKASHPPDFAASQSYSRSQNRNKGSIVPLLIVVIKLAAAGEGIVFELESVFFII
jgi:hypothetical protein